MWVKGGGSTKGGVSFRPFLGRRSTHQCDAEVFCHMLNHEARRKIPIHCSRAQIVDCPRSCGTRSDCRDDGVRVEPGPLSVHERFGHADHVVACQDLAGMLEEGQSG